jgi:acyl carrier protein
MTENPTAPSRDSVIETLRAALVKVTARDPASVSLAESTRLREDLGLDSYAAVELVFEVEDLAGVRITREAASSFQTVGDVVSCVIEQLSTTQAPAAPTTGSPGQP